MSNSLLVKSAERNANIREAAEMLRSGALVAFPTETVYGVGALVTDDDAVQSIYTTKGRPADNPLIVHVADHAMAERYGNFNYMAHKLADAFFPSALTLVVPAREGAVSQHVLAGGDTIALRAPNHPPALALINELEEGIAAPSANRSGRISPTQAGHVMSEFAADPGNLAMILDGGATTIGLESTVVECCEKGVRILRTGSVQPHEIAAFVPVLDEVDESHIAKSPGLSGAHYAPKAELRMDATETSLGEALLAFGSEVPKAFAMTLNLSAAGDLDEAAAHLYAYLRLLDATHDKIAVMSIPERDIGVAINDRLRRAAMKA